MKFRGPPALSDMYDNPDPRSANQTEDIMLSPVMHVRW
jgi:hypothetical protein